MKNAAIFGVALALFAGALVSAHAQVYATQGLGVLHNPVLYPETRYDRTFWTGLNLSGAEQSAAIDANGNFRARGIVVNSVNTSTVAINGTFYGFTREVGIGGASLFSGNGQVISLGDIQPGDFLAVKGSFNASTSAYAIDQIYDLSFGTAVNSRNSAIQAQINQLLLLVKQLQTQLQTMTGR